MHTRVFAVDGRGFDGGVVDPVPAAPGEMPEGELVDEYMATLSRLFTNHLQEESAAAAKNECARLLMQRVHLNEACAAFIEKQPTSMRERLIEQHEESKKAVRDHQKKIDVLQKSIAEAQAELNTKKDGVARAMTAFRTATEQRNGLGRYATRAAIAEADAALQKAEKAVDRANAAQTSVQEYINHLVLVEREPLIKERDRLMAEELELAASLSGESFTNALGIVVPARRPL